MVFQDPLTSLGPALFRIGDSSSWRLSWAHEKGDQAKKEALGSGRPEMLANAWVSPPERLGEYPHQMSGGMRQRIMIGIGP